MNNIEYYNLGLDSESLKIIYNYYRNTLFHHSVLTPNIVLDIGQPNEKAFEKINGIYILKLVSFYNISVLAVNKLLNDPKVLQNNKTIENIEKKI